MVERQDAKRSTNRATRRPSLARSLTVALVGLTVVLALAAAAGIGGIYSARQDYEDALARAYSLEAASSALFASGVVEQAALQARGSGSAALRRRARVAYEDRARRARALAAGDPVSRRLVDRAVANQDRIVRLSRGSPRSAAGRVRRTREALAQGQRSEAALVARQGVRREEARAQTRDDTRSAALIAGGAGLLALLGAVGLVVSLAGTIRRPLDELVGATRRLADGDLGQRVQPGGPREIQELDASFNEMAEELEQAQIRLEAERASLALTIESLGDALVVTNDEGVVTAANPRAAELVPGLTRGADAYAGDSPLPSPELGLAGDVAIEVGGRSLAATAGRLPAARGAGLVWTIRDVSERARLERMKSDFVATASHELRSPLTSIKGFVELLGRSDALGDREREFVDVVLQSTDRLVELVNDLLDVARLEAGRMEIHARLFDLAGLIDEVAVLMGPRVQAKDQSLILDLPPGLPKILGDPVRVRQVLVNLISNAHLYTDEGGTITVIADGDGQEIELSVTDDGHGMAQEDLDRVFDQFVRRDDTTGGTGLGLSIVRSLVDLQGGTVDVRSQVGEGTVFTVRLPAEGSGSQAARRAVAGSVVLVLTPRADLAGSLVERVEASGAKASAPVAVAPTLGDLRGQRYDVLLLDAEGLGERAMGLLADLREDPDLGGWPLVTVCSEEQDLALAGEWRVRADVAAEALAGTLGAAIVAERSSILVVGRSALRERVEATLLATGLDHQWATTGTAAAQACRGERFEVALVDAGMRAVDHVLDSLDLRGRRQDKAVIVFTDGSEPAPASAAEHPTVLAAVPLESAASAAVEALAEATAGTLERG